MSVIVVSSSSSSSSSISRHDNTSSSRSKMYRCKNKTKYIVEIEYIYVGDFS